jgi:surfactin synthase thioesterase subunit
MSSLISTSSEWLRGYDERPDARARIICFPHAGGSAAFYRPWHRGLPPHIELHAVQYPGRAERRTAPLVDNVQTMAEHVVADLAPLLDRPLALFGHSMGAFIAYEAARLLDEQGTPPAHLFVSGQIPPWIPPWTSADPPSADPPSADPPSAYAHSGTATAAAQPQIRSDARSDAAIADADDEDLVRHLQRLGGTETELLADPELREIFLPYIRSDFRMLHAYRPTPGPPLTTAPITALTGADDPLATPALAAHWRNHTSAQFALQVFPGGHFFLQPEQPAVLDLIATRIAHERSHA